MAPTKTAIFSPMNAIVTVTTMMMMMTMNNNRPLRWHLDIEMEFDPTVTIQSPLRSIPTISPRYHHPHLHHHHLMKPMSIINPVRLRSVDPQVHQLLWSPRDVHTSDEQQLQVFSSLNYSSGTLFTSLFSAHSATIDILCVSCSPSLSFSGVLNAKTNQRIIHPRSLLRFAQHVFEKTENPFERKTTKKNFTMTYLLSSCASDSLSLLFPFSSVYIQVYPRRDHEFEEQELFVCWISCVLRNSKWIISHPSDT